MSNNDDAVFKNQLTSRVIQHGDNYVIVYDWTKTADEIIAEANSIVGFRDQDGVRWYFVMWSILGPSLHTLDDERLRYFVKTLHETMRNHRVN